MFKTSYLNLQLGLYLLILLNIKLIFFYMKNPIKPTLKTEWQAILMIILSGLAATYFVATLPNDLIVAFSRDGRSNEAISWTSLSYIWPVLLSVVYLMFLFFPYLKINHKDAGLLKDDWHKAKEIVLSFFFILQVISTMSLSGNDKNLIWAMPILFGLFLIYIISAIVKISHKQKNK